mmetsp:Transcript_49537/g.105989  ORF Transcript_49537/g.105989 Transcript_49537/m.105989 type:complete len:232 (-) Transcript_49537:16-711(-)
MVRPNISPKTSSRPSSNLSMEGRLMLLALACIVMLCSTSLDVQLPSVQVVMVRTSLPSLSVVSTEADLEADVELTRWPVRLEALVALEMFRAPRGSAVPQARRPKMPTSGESCLSVSRAATRLFRARTSCSRAPMRSLRASATSAAFAFAGCRFGCKVASSLSAEEAVWSRAPAALDSLSGRQEAPPALPRCPAGLATTMPRAANQRRRPQRAQPIRFFLLKAGGMSNATE